MLSLIAAPFYKFIYLLFVFIATLYIANIYKQIKQPQYSFYGGKAFCVLLVVFLILVIGFRPNSGLFGDTVNYTAYYLFIEGQHFTLNLNTANLIFDNLFMWWGANRLGISTFFLLIAGIYFGCAYLGIKRLFPNHTLPAYLVFLGAFSTFSYATNGIKAGAAASIFILALSYRKNLKVCIPLILLSWGFHHSMQMPIAAFVLTMFYKSPKWYYYGWLFCLIMAIGHISLFQNLFASYTDESGAGYLSATAHDESSHLTGFRLDFVLYSAVPIVIGYIMEVKRKIAVSDLYRDMLHLYICINGIWLLCMYASYTNRIAYLSWLLYPIVLIYPFLYENWGQKKYRIFGKVMLWHVAFTVFMEAIYYGGLMELF